MRSLSNPSTRRSLTRIFPLFLCTCAHVFTSVTCAGAEETSDLHAADREPNRLIDENSPYLRQHAYNPVDWFPWGEEAFAKAREENKPIFLSVGYSTCHWCHVMERESFANAEIAAMLNENFVSIKVDREERPDVDRVYMAFVQATTGSGGWPMSVWLTPELKPFIGGTYFPPETSHGRPGFRTVLTRIADLWENNQEKVVEQSDRVLEALRADTLPADSESSLPSMELRRSAYDQTEETYDSVHGGFGQGPKFPHPVTLEFLFDVHATSEDQAERDRALEMTLETLRHMADGGIHDHIGGGFHRYSVDRRWRVPHFEKMLYDQAQLAVAYLNASQLSDDPVFENTLHYILTYVQRGMTDPEGGFYSAEDADSSLAANPEEHGEGAFYIWSASEIAKVLGTEDASVFAVHFGLQPDGNVAEADDPQGEFVGKNILFRAHSISETAAAFDLSESETTALIKESSRKLFEARSSRPRPLRDEKILTAWNGLMISAFARAAQATGNDSYLRSAANAARFARTHLYYEGSGRLARSYIAGEKGVNGFAEDYAFFIQGLLDLYETTFELEWLQWAISLQERQHELFWDAEQGGYFSNTDDDPSVLIRMKEDYDGAEPSANSIAVRNLARLSGMLHREQWQQQAEKTARAFATRLGQTPTAMPQMLVALGWLDGTPKQVLIHGERNADNWPALVDQVWSKYLPRRVLLAIDEDSRSFFEKQVEFIEGLPDDTGGIATAYVCENFVCQLPTSDPTIMAEQLSR